MTRRGISAPGLPTSKLNSGESIRGLRGTQHARASGDELAPAPRGE